MYDPKVEDSQILQDLANPKFEWDHPVPKVAPISKDAIDIIHDPYEAANGAHGICVLTEWDEFKGYDYQKLYDSMVKPAFVFDGRNVLDHAKLR